MKRTKVIEFTPEVRAVLAELIALREMLLTSTLDSVRAIADHAILGRIDAIAHGHAVRTLSVIALMKWVEGLGDQKKKGAAL